MAFSDKRNLLAHIFRKNQREGGREGRRVGPRLVLSSNSILLLETNFLWVFSLPQSFPSLGWPRGFTFTLHFHALQKEMATHSSVLAWRIPGTGEPGGLLSMGSHRVGHD